MNELEEALHWRQLLFKAVEEKGEDYQYPKAGDECLYFEYDYDNPVHHKYEYPGEQTLEIEVYPVKAPSCIVGHAMWYDSNYTPEELAHTSEGAGASEVVGVSFPNVGRALDLTQKYQDEGVPWGDALKHYDSFCKKYIPGYREAVFGDESEAA